MSILTAKVEPRAPRRYIPSHAPVAELVDAPDSKSGSARSAGSSPARGTNSAFAVVPGSAPTSEILLAQPLRFAMIARVCRSALVPRRNCWKRDKLRGEPAADYVASRFRLE